MWKQIKRFFVWFFTTDDDYIEYVYYDYKYFD
jgi:hypothetical protein